MARRKLSSLATASTDELVRRRQEAEEAEQATKRAERAAANSANKAAAQQAIVKEQKYLDDRAARPHRGMKGALLVDSFVAAKVLWVGRWKR